ncbi:MAG: hypothetical protein WD009_05035 [Phycisphaeraceae bacterium]
MARALLAGLLVMLVHAGAAWGQEPEETGREVGVGDAGAVEAVLYAYDDDMRTRTQLYLNGDHVPDVERLSQYLSRFTLSLRPTDRLVLTASDTRSGGVAFILATPTGQVLSHSRQGRRVTPAAIDVAVAGEADADTAWEDAVRVERMDLGALRRVVPDGVWAPADWSAIWLASSDTGRCSVLVWPGGTGEQQATFERLYDAAVEGAASGEPAALAPEDAEPAGAVHAVLYAMDDDMRTRTQLLVNGYPVPPAERPSRYLSRFSFALRPGDRVVLTATDTRDGAVSFVLASASGELLNYSRAGLPTTGAAVGVAAKGEADDENIWRQAVSVSRTRLAALRQIVPREVTLPDDWARIWQATSNTGRCSVLVWPSGPEEQEATFARLGAAAKAGAGDNSVAVLLVGEHEGGELLELKLIEAATAHGFAPVDREHLREILDEQMLAAMQADDHATRMQFGQMIGAEVLALVEPAGGEAGAVRIRLIESRSGVVLNEVMFAWDADVPLPEAVQEALTLAGRRLDVAVEDRLYLSLPTATWEARPEDGQRWLAMAVRARLRALLQAEPRVTLLEREALANVVQEQWVADLPVILQPTAAMVELGLRPADQGGMMQIAVRVTQAGADEMRAERREVEANPATLAAAAHEATQALLDAELGTRTFNAHAEAERLVQRAQWVESNDAALEMYEAAAALMIDDHGQILTILGRMSTPAIGYFREADTDAEIEAALERYLWMGEMYREANRRVAAEGTWPQGVRIRSTPLRGINSPEFVELKDHPVHGDAHRRLVNYVEQELAFRLRTAEALDSDRIVNSAFNDAMSALPYVVEDAPTYCQEAIGLLDRWRAFVDPRPLHVDYYTAMVIYDLIDGHRGRGWSASDLRPLMEWCIAEGSPVLQFWGKLSLAGYAERDEAIRLAREVFWTHLTDDVQWDDEAGEFRYDRGAWYGSEQVKAALRILYRHDAGDQVLDELLAHFEEVGDFNALAADDNGLSFRANMWDRRGEDRRTQRLMAAMEKHEWTGHEGTPYHETYFYRRLQRNVRTAAWHGGDRPVGPLWRQVEFERVAFHGPLTQTHQPIGHHVAYDPGKSWQDQIIYLMWVEKGQARRSNASEVVFTRAPAEGGELEVIARGRPPAVADNAPGRVSTDFRVADGRVVVRRGVHGLWLLDERGSRTIPAPLAADEAHYQGVSRVEIIGDVGFVVTESLTQYRFFLLDLENGEYELLADPRSVAPRTSLDGVQFSIDTYKPEFLVPDPEHRAFYVFVRPEQGRDPGLWRYALDSGEFSFTGAHGYPTQLRGLRFRGDELLISLRRNREEHYRIDRATGRAMGDGDYWPEDWPEAFREAGADPGRHVRLGPMYLGYGSGRFPRSPLLLMSSDGQSERHPEGLPGFTAGWETDYGAWLVIPQPRQDGSFDPHIYRLRYVGDAP